MLIDFHTHAFPDDIATRAVEKIAAASGVKTSHDGTVAGLIKSMDSAGIDKSVVLNIATKPSQAENIIEWCLKIRDKRLEPFASVHPGNKDYAELLKKISSEGLKGIKFHPMYQRFDAGDEKMFPVYEEAAKLGLIAVFHSGFDIAFPDDTRASVDKIAKIAANFPQLHLVAAHTGGWKMWREVLENTAGTGIYFDVSMTGKYIDNADLFQAILEKHGEDRLLFGSDCPWGGQAREVSALKEAVSSSELREKIFYKNAAALLAG